VRGGKVTLTLFILKDRLEFIRRFYETAAKPFEEIKRKIGESEAPYDNPPYSEDGLPPFLDEWQEAEESLQFLGHACVSMLAAVLRLYFNVWERELGRTLDDSCREQGWINKYAACFKRNFGIDFRDGPSDLSLLEEIVLARNRIQHPEYIASPGPNYSRSDLEKLPRALFIDDVERLLFMDEGKRLTPWLTPCVSVPGEKLRKALEQVGTFADWLERQIAKRLARDI
jgi:hypothetical protein